MTEKGQIESEDCTPSLSQSIRLKKLSQAGQLNADKIFAVMSEEKANQKERISFPFEDVRRFFPKSYTQKDVYNAIEIPECGGNYKADTRKGVAVEYITKFA